MKIFQKYVLPALSFVLPLGLYLKTLAPTYIPIDSAEFAMCMKFWGVCHPPGFPLYTLIGHLFIKIFPIGSVIYKANLLSALFGAGTVFLIYAVLRKLEVKPVNSFLFSIFFAVSASFWEFSIAADVFTFATFLIVLSIFLVFKRQKLPALFVLGLSTSHFYISAILFPVFFGYFFWGKRSQVLIIIREFAIAVIVFATGLFPQVIMYLRIQDDPLVNWGHVKGIWGFVDFVRRKEFGSIFLLSNPALVFSPVKVFKQFQLYFANFFTNFAVIFPFVALVAAIPLGFFKKKNFLLLFCAFLILLSVQLVLLSTIDPTGQDNPFQLNKFYLSSFTIGILWIAMVVSKLEEKIFPKDSYLLSTVLGFVILIYSLANFKTNNYSANYFSKNMVLDSFEQLPKDSVAITVSHVFYFGGLYEQNVEGKYKDITLLYFPNDKNRDNEYYHPDLFAQETDWKFVNKVREGKVFGNAETYILQMIAKNSDKDIYILQGSFEEGFFQYLKPYIVPWGLWWKVESDLPKIANSEPRSELLTNLRNGGIKFSDLVLKQQKLDLLNYAVSYHSTAVYLASKGLYVEAEDFFNRSTQLRSDSKSNENIKGELDLISKTRKLENSYELFIANKDIDSLNELGNNYYTLGNYEKCIKIYSDAVNFSQTASVYNNRAACNAMLGKRQEAISDYQKALELDPNLDLAKRGLETLKND